MNALTRAIGCAVVAFATTGALAQGTVAFEWQGQGPTTARAPIEQSAQPQGKNIELKAVKPNSKGHQH